MDQYLKPNGSLRTVQYSSILDNSNGFIISMDNQKEQFNYNVNQQQELQQKHIQRYSESFNQDIDIIEQDWKPLDISQEVYQQNQKPKLDLQDILGENVQNVYSKQYIKDGQEAHITSNSDSQTSSDDEEEQQKSIINNNINQYELKTPNDSPDATNKENMEQKQIEQVQPRRKQSIKVSINEIKCTDETLRESKDRKLTFISRSSSKDGDCTSLGKFRSKRITCQTGNDINSNLQIEKESQKSEEEIIDENTKQKLNEFEIFYFKQKIKGLIYQLYQNLPTTRFKSLQKNHYDLVQEEYVKINAQDLQKKLLDDNKNHHDGRASKVLKQSFQVQELKQMRLRMAMQDKHKYIKYIIAQIQSMKKKINIPIIHPEQKIALVINSIRVILFLCITFIISSHICFGFQYQELKQISYFYDGIITLQILEGLIMNKMGFYNQGSIEMNQKKIMLRYFKEYFIYDFIAFLILIVFKFQQLNNTLIIILEILYMLKIINFNKIVTKLEFQLYMSGTSNYKMQLIQLFSKILVIQHWIACLWHLLQIYMLEYHKEENSWANIMNIEDESWIVRYFQSYYWAVSTLMLIGAQPFTPQELIFTIFLLCITVNIFAYILQQVSSILVSISLESQEYFENLEIINKFMKSKNLSQETQFKVRTYLNSWQESSKDIKVNKQASEVLQKMPIDLKKSITKEINTSISKNFKILQDVFSTQTIKKMVTIMEDVQYVTNDEIPLQEDVYIYLILTGEITLYLSKEKEIEEKKNSKHMKVKNIDIQRFPIKVLMSGQIFNEIQFFTGFPSFYHAYCTKFSNVCRIKRSDFIQILQQNNDDFEKYCSIKDKLQHFHQTKYFDLNCKICNSKFHQTIECNLLFYNPYKYNIYQQQRSYSKEAERKRYKRFERNEYDYYKRFFHIDPNIKRHYEMLRHIQPRDSYQKRYNGNYRNRRLNAYICQYDLMEVNRNFSEKYPFQVFDLEEVFANIEQLAIGNEDYNDWILQQIFEDEFNFEDLNLDMEFEENFSPIQQQQQQQNKRTSINRKLTGMRNKTKIQKKTLILNNIVGISKQNQQNNINLNNGIGIKGRRSSLFGQNLNFQILQDNKLQGNNVASFMNRRQSKNLFNNQRRSFKSRQRSSIYKNPELANYMGNSNNGVSININQGSLSPLKKLNENRRSSREQNNSLIIQEDNENMNSSRLIQLPQINKAESKIQSQTQFTNEDETLTNMQNLNDIVQNQIEQQIQEVQDDLFFSLDMQKDFHIYQPRQNLEFLVKYYISKFQKKEEPVDIQNKQKKKLDNIRANNASSGKKYLSKNRTRSTSQFYNKNKTKKSSQLLTTDQKIYEQQQN